MRTILALGAVIALLGPATGRCQAQTPSLSDVLGLEKPIDRLGLEARATVQQFVAAVERASKESEAWRDVVDRMRADFAALPREAGLETKAVVDFLTDRAKENLADMAAVTAAVNQRDYLGALKLFREMQNRTASQFPPVVGNFAPKNLPIKWTGRDTHVLDAPDRTVILTGWNFNPDGKALKAEARDAAGKLVRDVTQHLKVSTRYVAQLDIAAGSGVGFQPGETEVVLVQADRVLARVPVVWGVRPPPQVLITALRFTYRTMDEDKDNDGGHVHAGVFWNGKPVGEGPTQGKDDPERVWRDLSVNGPFELRLSTPVPYDSVGQVTVEVRHWRERRGDPAWRLRVHRVEAVLSDGTTPVVLTEDDQAQKDRYNHRPGRQQWHSFDLRGRRGEVLRTPQIPLSKR